MDKVIERVPLTADEEAAIKRNNEESESFRQRLDEYISNPTENQRQPILIGQTPNVLLALGAKQLKMVIRPSEIDKCMATEDSSDILHPHNLSFEDISDIPKLTANPVMVFKGSHEGSIVALTDKYDRNDDPIIIAVQFNSKQDEYIVNRVTSMYGKENSFEPFKTDSDEIAKGYIERNIDDGNLLAYNMNKAPDYLLQAGLLLPVGEDKFVSYDNSIAYSMKSVKYFNENIFKELGFIMENKQEHLVYQYELIGKKLHLHGEGEEFQMYKILAVNTDNSVKIERDDSWTFDAVGFELNSDGTIEWGYSKNGIFTDEVRLQEHLKKEGKSNIKENKADYIDTPLGKSEVPSWIADKFNNMSDIDLMKYFIENEKKTGFIDPFAYKYMIDRKLMYGSERFSVLEEKLNILIEKESSQSQTPSDGVEINPQENKPKTGGKVMNITAKATPIENGTNLKGLANININGQFTVNSIRIVEGKDGLFVSMPSKKDSKSESGFSDIAFPVTKELQEQIKNAVLDAYHNPAQEKSFGEPEPLKVALHSIKENTHNNSIKASGEIRINDDFVVKDVKIVEGKNGLFVQMPSYQDQNLEYQNIAHPSTKDFYKQLQETVLNQYQNRAAVIGNTKYNELGGKDDVSHFHIQNKTAAEKLCKQLDADGVKWSGKIDNKGTTISVNKADEAAYNKAVTAVKPKPPTH